MTVWTGWKLAVAVALVMLALAGSASAAGTPLWKAMAPPTEQAYLKPAHNVSWMWGTEGYNCRAQSDTSPAGWFTDVAAYRWNGTALGRQQWVGGPFPHYVWRDHAGRAVTWDGIMFRNHTRHPVIVAGWCA